MTIPAASYALDQLAENIINAPRASSLSTEATAVVDADGVSRSSGTAVDTATTVVVGDGNASHIRTVSPTTNANNEFPSTHVCPFLINEPPIQGAYFDIPGANGELSQQVFEYSRLYWYIATLGTGRSFRSVRHPLNGGLVGRQEALPFVRRVSPELQAVFDQERLRRGLTLDDDEPIGPSDNALFDDTMRRVRDT